MVTLSCGAPNEETTDCAPFKCDPLSGTCKESCTSVRDCPSGYVCTLEGACERKPTEKAEDASGCGLAGGAPGAPARGSLFVAALLALAAARRRARL